MNLQENIRRVLREELDKKQKVFYTFSGLKNHWVDDNDRTYHDGFFDNKDYEDFHFDNFYDMDGMFGHENSLFGTRGLPVGHPDRSSKSFNIYNKKFGPMIVRVIKNNDLQESIRRILREENKKSGLLRAIEEDGLYEVITSTSLHIHEIEQKVGQLSREILERFIIDVVKENHSDIDEDGQTYYIYLEDYPFNVVPVGNNNYVEQLKVTNNELFFVVSHFEEDKYGELEFSSMEFIPSNNLEYDNIYEIAGQMGFLLSKGLI